MNTNSFPFPHFNRNCPYIFIRKFTDALYANNIIDLAKQFQLFESYLDPLYLAWFRNNQLRFKSWSDFNSAYIRKFCTPYHKQIVKTRLLRFRQNSLSIQEYIYQFELIWLEYVAGATLTDEDHWFRCECFESGVNGRFQQRWDSYKAKVSGGPRELYEIVRRKFIAWDQIDVMNRVSEYEMGCDGYGNVILEYWGEIEKKVEESDTETLTFLDEKRSMSTL